MKTNLNPAITVGLIGNEISKEITGTKAVSTERTTVAVGAGAATGALAGGTIAIGAAAVGISAPVTVPLAVAGAVVAGIASLFD